MPNGKALGIVVSDKNINIKVKKKPKPGIDTLTRDTIWESDKTQ